MSLSPRHWSLREPFVISRQTITSVTSVEVTLADEDGRFFGKGASVGLDYAGETAATMIAQIDAARRTIERSFNRSALLDLLPAGGARAAVDAALWDLEAKRSGRTPFQSANVAAAPIQSTITLGMRAPDDMYKAAAAASAAPWLKLKVGRHDAVATVAAARRGAPKSRLLVDPNQAWTIEQLNEYAPSLAAHGVELLEQPTAVGREHELDGYVGTIPLCADESCDGPADLSRIAGRFSAINIKLDKIGGLTAALALADAAEGAGLGLMVGCMLGSSLTVAPAMVLAQRCRWADLDGPPFLDQDDDPAFVFTDGRVEQPHQPALWG